MTADHLRCATKEEIMQQRSSTAYAFGVPLLKAVDAGYSIPPGRAIRTISDSRVGQQEARRMGELLAEINPDREHRPRILSLFDGIGSTSYAIARTLPYAEVVGVDLDNEANQRGIHNVENAGLSNQVTLVQADALEILEDPSIYDAIFLDPLWTPRPQGYLTGTFSIRETQPPLDEVIPKALKRAPLVVARAPIITTQKELVTLNETLGTELFIDETRIPDGQETIVAYFGQTGKTDASVREATLRSGVWETTVYQKIKQ